ncbi:MAG TPA: carboxypeptidase-like regulatory domain-containing protein [Blastocatellia bacterium]|nr:carboxypeptidase-like regulatory domain-containing protein [Blastocatellia bacterium]
MGEITGRVVTEDGTGLPNIMVFLNAVSRESRVTSVGSRQNQTSTDIDGNFKFTGLASGSYMVNTAVARGYIQKRIPLAEGQVPTYYQPGDNATITMIKGGVITGRVSNVEGVPLIGAQISAVMVRDVDGKTVRTVGFVRPRLTDDRGVYRFYGLTPGTYLVFTQTTGAGPVLTPYDGEIPTYHPSSTQDTATEVTVTSGGEAVGVDIRHRGERGRVISGVVSGAMAAESTRAVSVTLFDTRTEKQAGSSYIQQGGPRGFAFQSLTDGEYILIARTNNEENNLASAPRRVSLGGKDVTGVDLKLLPLGSISGNIVVESLPEACGEKRKIQLEEFSTIATRDDPQKDALDFLPQRAFSSRRANEKGEFTINNVDPGHYRIRISLTDENLYLKEITSPSNIPPRRGSPAAVNSVSRHGLALKQGENFTGVTVTVAEGAASLSGKVVAEKEDARLPERLRAHLVPVEPNANDEALRYAETIVRSDGAFAFTNIAPGKYRLTTRVRPEDTPANRPATPLAWDANERAKLRREALAAKNEIELQPCGRVKDFVLRINP